MFNSVHIRQNISTFGFSHELDFYWAKIGTTRVASRIMDPKQECLNNYWSADEVAEYIDRFNFWIDTRGTSDEKAIKGAFLKRSGRTYLPRATPKP